MEGRKGRWIEPQGRKQSPSALDKTRDKSLSYPGDLRQKEKMTDSWGRRRDSREESALEF